MRCNECGTDLLLGKRFCHTCGARASVACKSCGASVEPGFRFCPDCGAVLDAEAATGPGVPADPLTRHIPEDLARKIRAAAATSGERKRATVLFCDLVGSTAIAEGLDPEVYREILDDYLEVTFAEIYRFEGIVNQLSGDGFMALFGAPVAHEDDAERAVRAALGIQSALSELSDRIQRAHGVAFDARIGIHTGTVVVGTVGNDLKMDYTAVGDTTNLAARLQDRAAPGAILISDATARLVEGRVRARSVGPFNIKGKSARVKAYEVAELIEVRTPIQLAAERGLTPLVGRDEELAQLQACYTRMQAGLAQIVSIVGEAGSGKSRLIYEFRRTLREQGATLFEARCSSLSQNVPFAPWNMMLSSYVGVEAGEAPERVRERVEMLAAAGGLRQPDDALYLTRLLGVPVPELASISSAMAAENTFKAFDGMIVTAARRGPTVMLIEELHWMDNASRAALDRVMASFGRGTMMIVVTHRPDYPLAIHSDAAFTQLRIRGLTNAQAVAIVRARAGGELPEALEKRLLRRGEGNPLFLEELTRALVDAGALETTDDGVRLTRPIEMIEIPDTLQELLGARLDRLPAGAKRVAQIASVLGRQFRRERLVELMDDEPIDVERELEVLEHNGVLHRKAGGESTYRFGESMTQEVAYEALLLRERRKLHDRIARSLLSDVPEGDAGRLALVGHHFARGDDVWMGIDALLTAGQRAQQVPSYEDSVNLYEEAWRLAERAVDETPPSREQMKKALDVARGLTSAIVLYSGGAAIDAEEIAQRGLEFAASLGDEVARAALCANLGFLIIGIDRDRFAEGLALIEQSVEVARSTGDEQTTAALERGLAWAYLMDGRFEDARRGLAVAMAELERLGHRDELSDVYMGARFFLGRVLYESDQLQASRDYAEETWALAEKVDNRTLRSAAASAIAVVAFLKCDVDGAWEWAARAARLSGQIQNVAAMRTAAAVQVMVALDRGETPEEAPLEVLRRGLMAVGELALNVDLAVTALIRAGEVGVAHKLAESAARRSGGRLRESRTLVSRGEVYAAMGADKRPGAERAFEQGLELADQIGAASVAGRAHLGLASIACEGGDPERARRHALRAEALLDYAGFEHFARRARVLRDGCGTPVQA